MRLFVNNVNLLPYVAPGGLKWQRADIESESAGRTLDGVMHRGRIGTKIRLDITCKPLKASELATVLNAIYPEYVTVYYDDPLAGYVQKKMYSNNNPASLMMIRPNGDEVWTGVTFPLIEQ